MYKDNDRSSMDTMFLKKLVAVPLYYTSLFVFCDLPVTAHLLAEHPEDVLYAPRVATN